MKDPIHNHLDQVQDQLHALQGSIERLPEQIAAIILAAQEIKQPAPAHTSATAGSNGYGHRVETQPQKEQYSFLIDEDMVDVSNRSMGHEIAPEAQVQRLTAQLTAAYNRIAALEEQLLSQRMSH